MRLSADNTFFAQIITVFLMLLTLNVVADELVEEELLGLYGSEEFISIATGFKQELRKAPAVASIITREDIKRIGARDIDDVLETVPGLHVSVNYQGYNPIYTFRGIYSGFNPQVLMLVNGVSQANLFNGGRHFVWGGFPVEAIERIEVIRGPGSAIYGADAFAGVINIITKDAQAGDEAEVGVKAGELDYKSYFVNYAKKYDDFSYGIYVEHGESEENDEVIESDAQKFLDTLYGTNASKAPGNVNVGIEKSDIRLAMNYDRLDINAYYQRRRDGKNGVGVGQALDPVNRFDSDRLGLDFSYKVDQWVDDISIDLSGSYQKYTQEVAKNTVIFPIGSTGPQPLIVGGTPTNPIFYTFPDGLIGNPEVYETHSRADMNINYSGFDSHKITVGLGYYYGDLYKVNEEKNYCTEPLGSDSCNFILAGVITQGLADVSDTPYVFLKEGARDNYHIFLQDVYRFANDWELTAGVRYDDYSDFGETINPRLALVWSTTNRLTTKFLYGEAFRAPSFSETRNINNPAALGNPDLKPETLKSYELVFDYNPVNDFEYVLNAFYYEWQDIIQYVSEGGGANRAQNTGRQTGYGAEAEFKWQLASNFNLQGNFAIQRSTNEEVDHDSVGAPQKQLYLQANWGFARDWNLNFQANWVMDRAREINDSRNQIDDYALFDLSIQRENIADGLSGAIHLKNIFDEDAREPSPNGFPVAPITNDLPLPGRRVIGEIRYSF